jgi:hypothetical protein
MSHPSTRTSFRGGRRKAATKTTLQNCGGNIGVDRVETAGQCADLRTLQPMFAGCSGQRVSILPIIRATAAA